jgi:hypothetical protein
MQIQDGYREDSRKAAAQQSPGLAAYYAAYPGYRIQANSTLTGLRLHSTLSGLIALGNPSQGRPQKTRPTMGFDRMPFQGISWASSSTVLAHELSSFTLMIYLHFDYIWQSRLYGWDYSLPALQSSPIIPGFEIASRNSLLQNHGFQNSESSKYIR